MNWAYGVLTCKQRIDTDLRPALESLERGGFRAPRVFADGCTHAEAAKLQSELALPVTARYPAVRVAGNWVLALYELFYREPTALRYAVFQDDLRCVANLRQYLTSCKYADKTYWNLYSFPENEQLAQGRRGWYPSNQRGLGAVALVLDKMAVIELLSARHMAERPGDPHKGWQSIDGGIVTAFAKAGWRELVHSPSLVQHVGDASTMGHPPYPRSETFPGEGWDPCSATK